MSRIYRRAARVSIPLLLFAAQAARADEITPHGADAYQNVTGDDTEADRSHWDSIYSTHAYVFGKEPAKFLKDHIDLLPLGKVLDIAMGEGRNAVFMAKKGYRVLGVDYSEMALKKADRLARENRVMIATVNADLNSYAIAPNAYDVILNIDYLQRNLIPQIKKGLRRGGVVVFESYTVDQLKNAGGQALRQDLLLKKGELRDMFKDLRILVYSEINDGKEARASLIARKP